MKKIFGILLVGCIMISFSISVFAGGLYQGFEDESLTDETAVTVGTTQVFEGLRSAKVSRKWSFVSGGTGQPGAFLKLKTPRLTNTALTSSSEAVIAEGWFYDNYDASVDVAQGSPILPMLYFEAADNSWRLSIGAVRDNSSYNYYGCSFVAIPDETADWSTTNLTGYNDYILEQSSGNHWSWYHCCTSASGWRVRTKGWHHVQVVVKNGATSVYFDGDKDPRIGNTIGGNTKPVITVQGIAHPGTDTYKRFASSVNTDYLSNYETYYDGFAVYTEGTKFIHVSLGENGAISDETGSLANGQTLLVDQNATKEFTVTPADGYQVSDFTLDGVEYPVTDNKVSINCSGLSGEITSNKHTLSVSFEEKKEVVPEITIVTVGTPSTYESQPSNVIYGKIIGDPVSYGFELSNGQSVLPLEAKGKSTENAFGIRVYGAIFNDGTYTMRSFVTYRNESDEEQTNRGEEQNVSFQISKEE